MIWWFSIRLYIQLLSRFPNYATPSLQAVTYSFNIVFEERTWRYHYRHNSISVQFRLISEPLQTKILKLKVHSAWWHFCSKKMPDFNLRQKCDTSLHVSFGTQKTIYLIERIQLHHFNSMIWKHLLMQS